MILHDTSSSQNFHCLLRRAQFLLHSLLILNPRSSVIAFCHLTNWISFYPLCPRRKYLGIFSSFSVIATGILNKRNVMDWWNSKSSFNERISSSEIHFNRFGVASLLDIEIFQKLVPIFVNPLSMHMKIAEKPMRVCSLTDPSSLFLPYISDEANLIIQLMI